MKYAYNKIACFCGTFTDINLGIRELERSYYEAGLHAKPIQISNAETSAGNTVLFALYKIYKLEEGEIK